MRDLPSHHGKSPERSETQSPDTDHPSTDDHPLGRLLGGPNCDCLRNYEPKPIGPIRIGFFQIDADGSKPPGSPSIVPIIRQYIAEHGSPHPPTRTHPLRRKPNPPGSNDR